jgi:hypothetical protein
MFDMDPINSDAEKNITLLQKIKWRPNSRWPPKIVFGPESTNMLFFLEFFTVLRSFMDFFFNPNWRLVSRWRFCHFKITLFSNNPLQATTSTKIKILMDLQRIYILKRNNHLVCKRKTSIWR